MATITPALTMSQERRLSAAGFSGSDRSLDESLHEYSYLIRTIDDDAYQVIYFNPYWKQTIGAKNNPIPVAYGLKTIEESDLTDAFQTHKFGILNMTGLSEADWLLQSPINRLQDIGSYSSWFDFSPFSASFSMGQLLKGLGL